MTRVEQIPVTSSPPGLSPFAGANDVATLKNVKNCDWEFDSEAFKNVSEEGKDFIRRLLTKQKEKRMSCHECLQHKWLTGDHSHQGWRLFSVVARFHVSDVRFCNLTIWGYLTMFDEMNKFVLNRCNHGNSYIADILLDQMMAG